MIDYCFIKNAEYAKIPRTNSFFEREEAELRVLGEAVWKNSKNEKADKKKEEVYDEGVMLLLYSPYTKEEYQRFMSIDLINDFLSEKGFGSNTKISKENLEFFAEQLKNRKEPISMGIFDKSENIENMNFDADINDPNDKKIILGKIGKKGNKNGNK